MGIGSGNHLGFKTAVRHLCFTLVGTALFSSSMTSSIANFSEHYEFFPVSSQQTFPGQTSLLPEATPESEPEPLRQQHLPRPREPRGWRSYRIPSDWLTEDPSVTQSSWLGFWQNQPKAARGCQREKGDAAKLHLPQAVWSFILFLYSELSYLVISLVAAGQVREGRTLVLHASPAFFIVNFSVLFAFLIFYMNYLFMVSGKNTLPPVFSQEISGLWIYLAPGVPLCIELTHAFGQWGGQSSASPQLSEPALVRTTTSDSQIGRLRPREEESAGLPGCATTWWTASMVIKSLMRTVWPMDRPSPLQSFHTWSHSISFFGGKILAVERAHLKL